MFGFAHKKLFLLRTMRKIGWNEDVAQDRLSKVFWHRCGCHSGIFHRSSFFSVTTARQRVSLHLDCPGCHPNCCLRWNLSRPKENSRPALGKQKQGCVIVGNGAAEVINLAALAIQSGVTARDLEQLLLVHPSVSVALQRCDNPVRKCVRNSCTP
jgi:hypothetical protein